ncbi:hypothetical protein [Thermogemmatispora onikobensis]|uniref:hypothetical protein n=1 Tax=Thermogemmatispora onikobensis TaxID=732234 RepID=UPI0008531898|nr:hypothetical protein [Thermogemmatispora onikobensis]
MALIGSAAVVGIFEERSQVEQAIGELKAAGFRDDQITRLSREPLKLQEAGPAERLLERVRAKYNLTVLGGIVGAIGGGLFSLIASFVLPLAGVRISGGPVIALLEGLVLGALGGGFLGAIIGPSVIATGPGLGPRSAETEALRGRTIIMVRTLERQAEAAFILRKYGARNALVPRATETAAMAALRLAGPGPGPGDGVANPGGGGVSSPPAEESAQLEGESLTGRGTEVEESATERVAARNRVDEGRGEG